MSAQGEGRGLIGQRGFLPLLGEAGRQLLELERWSKGRPHAVGAEIARRLEGCALVPQNQAGERLVLLLRLRDLHRYVEAVPEQRPLKLAVLNGALGQRPPATRWAEMRGLILAGLPQMLDVRPEEVSGALKRDLSSADSPLGRLLRLAALLNLEAAGEWPPPGMVLRFARGRFPEHTWESRATPGGAANSLWQPATLLGRWEYLATDLVEQVCRNRAESRTVPWQTPAGRAARADGRQERAERAGGQTYCRLGEEGEDGTQLPLLPVQPETVLVELLGHVRRKLGAEGVRQAALVLATAANTAPGEPFAVDREVLISACRAFTQRDIRECSQKLDAVMKVFGEITVNRTCDALSDRREQGIAEDTAAGGTDRIRSGSLLTVLERHIRIGGTDGTGVERWVVSADRILWDEAGRPLGGPFHDLPAEVFVLSPREHPFAVALAAVLRRRFTQAEENPVELSPRTLADESGLAAEHEASQKVWEILKRDLNRLQDARMLGQWRLIREKAVRSPLDATLRLEPVQRPSLGRGVSIRTAWRAMPGGKVASADPSRQTARPGAVQAAGEPPGAWAETGTAEELRLRP